MRYDNEICNQFVEDMEKAGYEVQDYQGRFFWTGPAVRVNIRTSLELATSNSSAIHLALG
jgi:hypothetical protein